jgi:hypothetical protein
MAASRTAAERAFVFIASFAAVGLVIDAILLSTPIDGSALVVAKYPLAVAVYLLVLAGGRAIRRAEAACLEDLHD